MKIITAKIGETGEKFLQRNNLAERDVVDKQPAGLNFYEYDWAIKTPGLVRVEHGAHSFEIPFVLGITGTEDTAKMENGITDFQVRASITAADTMSHDEARKEVINLLKKLVSLGWKPFIPYENARAFGKGAFILHQEGQSYNLPLDYEFSLTEWMAIDVGRWYLYADDIFLQITFRRDRKLMDPNAPGAYILMFNLKNTIKFAKAYFEGEDRDRWQDLWIEKVKSLKKERYEKEAQLEKRGFSIFREYEEPKIHPADPVEP